MICVTLDNEKVVVGAQAKGETDVFQCNICIDFLPSNSIYLHQMWLLVLLVLTLQMATKQEEAVTYEQAHGRKSKHHSRAWMP